MTIYDLKPRFQALLRPISDWLVRHGITPNEVTIFALAISVVQGMALALVPSTATLLALPIVLLIRMALNAIDGMMAKEHNMQTKLGEWLNESGDIISDLALYAPFMIVLHEPLARFFLILFLVGTVASEGVGMWGKSVTGIRRYDGPMGKSDRALAMGILAVLLALYGENRLYSAIYIAVLFGAVWWTTARRILKVSDDHFKGVRR